MDDPRLQKNSIEFMLICTAYLKTSDDQSASQKHTLSNHEDKNNRKIAKQVNKVFSLG